MESLFVIFVFLAIGVLVLVDRFKYPEDDPPRKPDKPPEPKKPDKEWVLRHPPEYYTHIDFTSVKIRTDLNSKERTGFVYKPYPPEQAPQPKSDLIPHAEYKAKYYAYLKSDEWRDIRNIVLHRDSYECQRCYSRSNLQVHHLRYVYVFHEADNDYRDLTVICRDCHRASHGIH